MPIANPSIATSMWPTIFRWLAALFFIMAGINHFVMPHFYEPMVPPGIPSPKGMVIVSGIAEIAGGVGLLLPPFRRAAGWGLIALLIAIYPANIYMALNPEKFHVTPLLLWLRLPFQFLFFLWVWWVALQRKTLSRVSSQ